MSRPEFDPEPDTDREEDRPRVSALDLHVYSDPDEYDSSLA